MTPPGTPKQEIDIEVLKEGLKQVEKHHEQCSDRTTRLITSLSEAVVSNSRTLAVIGEKLENQNRLNEDFDLRIENRKKELQDETKRLECVIHSVETGIKEHVDGKFDELKAQTDGTEKRLRAIEMWRWIIIGGFMVVAFLFKNLPYIHSLLDNTPKTP